MELSQKVFNSIDPRLKDIDDERLKDLFAGKITEVEFNNLIRDDDPFIVVNGDLRLLTKIQIPQMKTTDRKQIIEILLTAANIELAAEHCAEISAINSDVMSAEELISAGESCKKMRDVRRDTLKKAAELVPEINGWWCVAKHLPAAEMQFYELYTQTGDKFYIEQAKKLKLIFDDLLSIDSSVNFKNCPRCETDKNI